MSVYLTRFSEQFLCVERVSVNLFAREEVCKTCLSGARRPVVADRCCCGCVCAPCDMSHGWLVITRETRRFFFYLAKIEKKIVFNYCLEKRLLSG